jgi:hypothetical protein
VSPSPIFRQRALDQIGSPDEFDRLVRVTSPRHWIGLTGLLVVVVAAVLWACLSTIPTTQSGNGFLLPEGGLRAIQSPAAGTLQSLDVDDEDHVVLGQRLGTVVALDGTRTPIEASGTGVVTEVSGQPGTHVVPGQQIGLVQPIGWPAVVYTYVSTEAVADIEPGMEARVHFAGGIGARYGDAYGTVSSVARFPATEQRLEYVLHGGAVSARPRAGATSEVVVELDQSAHTPSGLVWATGDGPPSVPLGIPATVQVVVGSRHPIDDVF